MDPNVFPLALIAALFVLGAYHYGRRAKLRTHPTRLLKTELDGIKHGSLWDVNPNCDNEKVKACATSEMRRFPWVVVALHDDLVFFESAPVLMTMLTDYEREYAGHTKAMVMPTRLFKETFKPSRKTLWAVDRKHDSKVGLHWAVDTRGDD